MVADITLSGTQAQAANTDNQRVTLAEDFDQFLTLLTTQLQNQDPLSPMDSTEFTNQLVQFSQVEQSINTNSKLDDLVNLQLSGAASAALGYVGLDISYISAEIAYDGSTPVDMRYSLESPATLSRINIFDEGNQLIYSQDAQTDAGAHEFTWDGRDNLGNPVPEGTYVLTVDAFDGEDNQIETTTVVTGRVKGIETQDGVTFALVGERAVPIPSILNASLPDEPQEQIQGDENGNT